VHTPTLRGLGDRAGELESELGVSAHVADVVAALDSLDGAPVVLVGHSYAGVVVRGAAQRRPDQVRRVVLVDGWVVPPGESILSICPPAVQESILSAAASTGGDYVPPMPPAMLGLVRPADIEAVYPRLTPHPLAGFTERIEPTPAADALPCTAIICTANPEPSPFRDFAEAGRVAHGWTVIPLSTGHDAMITAPDRLADALLSCAREGEQASVAAP
jgi:pimeloyl-ACP methyl ester carboxylesterase